MGKKVLVVALKEHGQPRPTANLGGDSRRMIVDLEVGSNENSILGKLAPKILRKLFEFRLNALWFYLSIRALIRFEWETGPRRRNEEPFHEVGR